MEIKKKIDYKKSEFDYIMEQCSFTDRQKAVIYLLRRGLNITQISMYNPRKDDPIEIKNELPMSESTIKIAKKQVLDKIRELILDMQ